MPVGDPGIGRVGFGLYKCSCLWWGDFPRKKRVATSSSLFTCMSPALSAVCACFFVALDIRVRVLPWSLFLCFVILPFRWSGALVHEEQRHTNPYVFMFTCRLPLRCGA